MRISDWSSDVCSSDLGILFGLADLGFGSPELGSFALAELESVRLPFGLGIERDILFEGNYPLSVYAAAAHRAGSLVLGEKQLSSAARSLRGGRCWRETGAIRHMLGEAQPIHDDSVGICYRRSSWTESR